MKKEIFDALVKLVGEERAKQLAQQLDETNREIAEQGMITRQQGGSMKLSELNRQQKQDVIDTVDALRDVSRGASIPLNDLLSLLTQQAEAEEHPQRGRPTVRVVLSPELRTQPRASSVNASQIAEQTLSQINDKHWLDEQRAKINALLPASEREDEDEDEVPIVERVGFDREKKQFVVKQKIDSEALAERTLARAKTRVGI